jgi:hypothetical protein
MSFRKLFGNYLMILKVFFLAKTDFPMKYRVKQSLSHYVLFIFDTQYLFKIIYLSKNIYWKYIKFCIIKNP